MAGERRGVKFTKRSAEAIAHVVRIVRGARPPAPPMHAAPPASAITHFMSVTPSQWSKASWMTLNVYLGEPQYEYQTDIQIRAWNQFADIPANKWVMLVKVGGYWRISTGECG
jgi:hypothetical protein